MKRKRIVVLSGAGVSAESGLRTFRDSDGLWEEHDVYDVATPEGWDKDASLVLRFYNERRTQLSTVESNVAHHAIAALENDFEVDVITQNVDDLHERAGSSNVVHLHGLLTHARSSGDVNDIWDIGHAPIALGDLCKKGFQVRPHIVWFGEAVPMIELAAEIVSRADVMIVVGTSLNVYPAAGLFDIMPTDGQIYLIDPAPMRRTSKGEQLTVIAEKATVGMPIVAKALAKLIND